MAQDLLDRFTPIHSHPTNILSPGIATWALRNGHRALKFPATGAYDAYFASVLNSLYNGSGILLTIVWTIPAASGGVTWEASFERQAAGVFNYTGSSFSTIKTVVTGAPVGSNLATYSQISFTGAEIDGLVAFESYRLKLRRPDDGVGQAAYVYRVFLQNLI